jgi:hypothetical protein
MQATEWSLQCGQSGGEVVRGYYYGAYREPSDDSWVLIALGQVFQVLQTRVCKTSGMASQVV